MSDEIEVFLSKVDAFAQGLSQTEQAMLAYLVADDPDDADDDVAGFNLFDPWPTKIRDIAPRKIGELPSVIPGITSPGDVPGVMGSSAGKGEI